MKPIIIDFEKCLDPDLPNIFKDRLDHFIVTLYKISTIDGDPAIVVPTYKYIREIWLAIYEEQGNTQYISAQNWLFGERQVAQAIREFTHGAGQYYESWTRRVARGHEFRYNHEAITDMILGEFGSRTFRIKPEDLKGLLDPHSIPQHDIVKEWLVGWTPRVHSTVSGTPIKWRDDVGGWL
jgi:hypothetical protein